MAIKTKTVAGQKIQKYVLNDYLHNLHQKFCMENPEIKISRSTFSKLRPSHVRKADFGNRKTRLCPRHQYFAPKFKALKNAGAQCSANPDVFVKQQEEVTEEQLWPCDSRPTNISYSQRKKVQDGSKYRWKVVQLEVARVEFLELLRSEQNTSSLQPTLHASRISGRK